MGLSIHSLGMKEGARADASGGVEKGLTQEFILLVFGCSEGVEQPAVGRCSAAGTDHMARSHHRDCTDWIISPINILGTFLLADCRSAGRGENRN
ncbi:hypothetical protein F7725_015852, partial [Dissostichus mawsoni]